MSEPHRSLYLIKMHTQGSETSQYLKEKKPKGIPEVAASEMGEAQTECITWNVMQHLTINL